MICDLSYVPRSAPCSARFPYTTLFRSPTCKGARLRPEVLAVTVGGRSIAEVTDMSIRDALTFHQELELGEREAAIADEVLREIRSRLGFLLDVGLDYLTMSRAAGTLSGGEAQRKIGRASCRERVEGQEA